MRDRGLTFAGTDRAGVCISFRDPVRGVEPFGFVRHPALTVTVAEPDALIEVLREQLADADPALDVEDELDRMDQESHDELEAMTAAELRVLARAAGIKGTSSMRKAELIDGIERAESANAAETAS